MTTLSRWQAAAVPITVADLLGEARSLGIIVPHADDETLGCGGLIASAAQRNLAITVTILTDGAASHPGSALWPPHRLAQRRRDEAHAAIHQLAGHKARLVFANAPDGGLDRHPETMSAVPPADLLVTCWDADPHPDHCAAFDIAVAVARRNHSPLLAFPLWTLTTDAPLPDQLLQLDVSPYMQPKRAALAAYRSQLGQLVTDVRGFVLDAELQRLFLRRDELFIRVC